MITELCAFLAASSGERVAILCRPDRHPQGEGLCDAIVMRGGKTIAVQHTRVFGAPNKPRTIQVLAKIRPVIQEVVLQAYPSEWVAIGVPVECFVAGHSWESSARDLAEALVHELGKAQTGERVIVELPRQTGRAFAEVRRTSLPDGFCSVNPCVWGREPEELTLDDFARALSRKRAGLNNYKLKGLGTLLVLDFEEMAWPPFMWDLALRAAEMADLSAYDDVFVALTAWTPCFLLHIAHAGALDKGGGMTEALKELRSATTSLLETCDNREE